VRWSAGFEWRAQLQHGTAAARKEARSCGFFMPKFFYKLILKLFQPVFAAHFCAAAALVLIFNLPLQHCASALVISSYRCSARVF
jgi:hypothetical protein